MNDRRRTPCAALLMFALAACGDDDANTANDGGMDASHMDASHMDARVDANMPSPSTWVATKTTLDVWWPGDMTRDPGRARIDIHLLTQHGAACEASPRTTRVCGITLPTFTNDLYCEAYSVALDDSVWDRPEMPRLMLDASAADDAGSAAIRAMALLGIEVQAGAQGSAWPTAEGVDLLRCASGTGGACFPDHEGDGHPGLTATVLDDGAEIVGPVGDGRCTIGRPFLRRGLPAFPELGVVDWGHRVGGVRATTLRMGLGIEVTAPSAPACDTGMHRVTAAHARMRAASCEVAADSLDPSDPFGPDPRIASLDYACNAMEARVADGYLPTYEVLDAGESPRDLSAPVSWLIAGRDIDRTPSEGTRSVSVVLNLSDIDAGDDEAPRCAQARAALRDM